MAAAVDLEQHARLRHPVATRTVLRGTSALRARAAAAAQDAPHRGPMQDDAVVLSEQLAEVLIVTAGVRAGGELEDCRLHTRVEGVWRSASAVAVDKPLRAITQQHRPQPPQMPRGAAEKDRRLAGRAAAIEYARENVCPHLCLRRHDDVLVHARTKSQNS